MTYHVPRGGLPPQTALTTDRAVFTGSYAVLPARTMSDITASLLPHWKGTRLWVLARPLSGFAETFAQYLMEVAPGGGSDAPEPDAGAEGVLFVVGGQVELTLGGTVHTLTSGGYAYLAAGTTWSLHNRTGEKASFHWIRKAYQRADGVGLPDSFVTHARDVAGVTMTDTGGAWSTQRFVDPSDLRHDMHVNIVTLQPGASIPFPETHVMEHGLFVLQGKALYLLNTDWVEVEAGDFMWLRAFCPQACYAGGPGPFSYLLYKDVNRHVRLTL
ncbi:bifunctional allantoicase/(S)-ureidoglycine aminohydrolase [Ornithinimicrobium cryptoxanthini]|uniref:Bifunctional allantoicase/(S)-ureidoglycine aminohydrolase n=1 Tax=Ornithinimicrobium cryptoxanthini TaxID=2934161 RepID=A0ABY4YLZ0_9MICO|nr:bifunctional allantoicase/(S)-ureidoglycine aminohydrolase [Ornithinimicrobium cryptoxanthini]USQ77373.1 bifunctional allantoicase/(S)-ureidoglycine aminohydrolase [Ornithinimicrobium cryptoxanthini]